MNWPACSNRRYSPPREEGWLRDQSKVAKPPYSAQTGWSLTNSVSECVLERWLVSDHPVRSIKGGFAASSWCRVHPSSRGGECAHTERFVISSDVLSSRTGSACLRAEPKTQGSRPGLESGAASRLNSLAAGTLML